MLSLERDTLKSPQKRSEKSSKQGASICKKKLPFVFILFLSVVTISNFENYLRLKTLYESVILLSTDIFKTAKLGNIKSYENNVYVKLLFIDSKLS